MSLTSRPVAEEPDPQPDPKQFSKHYLVRTVFDSQAEAVLYEKTEVLDRTPLHTL